MNRGAHFARFEFDPDFVQSGVQLAPLHMPLARNKVYQFSNLKTRSFHGLPGMLADCLPDKFGNRLIDIWIEQSGRNSTDFNAVDRLCYLGNRGMGALEFEPATETDDLSTSNFDIENLLALASMAYVDKEQLRSNIESIKKIEGLFELVKAGASAGGARAKAVIALNPAIGEIRSGQIEQQEEFEHWLINRL